MTVKVYNSANFAQKFTGTAGSAISIFDIILLGSGWTKPFTGTNVAVYRNGSGSRQSYFRIDDTGSTTGLTRNTKIRGYTTMTDATDAGTNPFPTTASYPQGYFIRKSATTDTTNREWFAVVDELVCYLIIHSEGTGGPVSGYYPIMYAFGDFVSDSPTDIYQSFVACIPTDSTSNPGSGVPFDYSSFTSLATSSRSGCVVAGTHGGVAGSLSFSRHISLFGAVGTFMMSPDAVPGGGGQMILSPYYIHYNNGTATTVRGIHQGLWFMHNEYQMFYSMNNSSDYSEFYIKGVSNSKTLKAIPISTSYFVLIETSDTWYQ